MHKILFLLTNEEKAQHEKVFETELLPHMDALKTFAYHLTFDDDDAEDLVQETYMKAFRFIDKYQPGTNAKAWLFKILKNAYINQYRKKVKQPKKVDFEEIISYHDTDDKSKTNYLDLREEIFENIMGDEITIAINNLPIDFRTVVLLCDVEGFTYEEISKIIDVPIGTVRSRLFRARNILKEKLKTYAATQGFADKRGVSKRAKSEEE
ncbi:sigma-70 family RNA polymerase sigma factor [Saprospiraceae bacterium]|nr:sigma-70 family RNA polymerase sigma factor [Saprospiraceae bacterium]